VIRRCPAPLTVMVATLLYGFGWQPVSTRADQVGVADYTLTTTTGLPVPSGPIPTSGSTNIPTPQIEAIVEPAGGVVTPATNSTTGPLSNVSGSGFDPNGVWDFLANATQNNQAVEGLGLSFYGQGLAAGGVVNFSLNVANVNDPPQISVISPLSGVTITLDPPASTSGSSSSSGSSTSGSSTSSGSVDSAPEPLSMLLWATLATAGLLRARALRRKGVVTYG
jgi:hypothetical protein